MSDEHRERAERHEQEVRDRAERRAQERSDKDERRADEQDQRESRQDIERRAEDQHPLRDFVDELSEDVKHLTALTEQLLSAIDKFVRNDELHLEVAKEVNEKLEPRVAKLEDKWQRKLSKRTAVFFFIVIGFAALTIANATLVLQLSSVEEDRAMAIRDALVVACEQNQQTEDALEDVLRVLAAPREDDSPGDHDRRISLLEQSLELLDSPPCEDLVEDINLE